MKIKLMVYIVFICLIGIILAGNSYPAQQKQKLRLRSIYEDYPADSPGGTKDCPKSGSHYVPTQTAYGGIPYQNNCEDIWPSVGTVIRHDQIGSTWYEFQQNGSIGRMISVSSDGYRNFSWMYCEHIYPPGPRYVDANCENPSGGYLGQAHVDGGETNAGYCNQTHLHDGTSVVVYHRTGGTPIWASTLAMADGSGSNSFNRHWDLPDYIIGSLTLQPGEWPKAEVSYDPVAIKDYIHVVMVEGSIGCSDPYKLPYERCYLGTNDTLICQNYTGETTSTYKLANNANGAGSFAPVSSFNTTCSYTPVIAVSPVSRRVALAFFRQADPANTCDYGSDVCFVESMSNGDDWIAGNPWPPPFFNVTNYGLSSGERGFSDLSACYDFQDSLHIVYVTAGFDSTSPGSADLGRTRLYHWSKKTGIIMIASKIQEDAQPGAHNMNIAKMSVSAQNPIYHPSGDSVYLYCIWTQFDSTDKSANGYGNGDLFGSGSLDGGATWGGAFNLTNTRTPGCTPGTCLSEHWSSLAQNMYDGDLHIQYICDKDAGGAIQDPPSAWLDNPVMYLHLSAWDVNAHPQGELHYLSHPDWVHPPLKITPGGTRNVSFQIRNIGNGPLTYSVSDDDPCIIANVPPTVLLPGDIATVNFIVDGTGACNNTFIDGNVIVTTDEPNQLPESIPLRAVVSNDYYECPRDPLTYDSLDNGILQMYVNANGQEWIHDVGSFPDTVHEVFFNGGPFVATTQSNDTLVGRYYGDNDEHTFAREKLYLNSMYNDFWLAYSWNVSIHKLNPPENTKWWWFELLHENVFFKPNAPDALKHCVIKFVTAERHNPPIWWPSQPTFTGYEDTYIGIMMDMDAPWDTLGGQDGRNRAGYDAVNNIAYQRGWDYTGAHPQYNDYYTGMALIQGFQSGESTVPWGTYNLRNDVYLYPQSAWGWKDGDFYRLAAGNVLGDIQQPDSIVDRSQILTAKKIVAGTNAHLERSFTVVEAIGTNGLADLQNEVAAARAWVGSAHMNHILCCDVNNNGMIEVGDIISLINYLFKNDPSSIILGPLERADCSQSGAVDVSDIVTLLNYLFKGYPEITLRCPGVW
jgi:hypothetical protein